MSINKIRATTTHVQCVVHDQEGQPDNIGYPMKIILAKNKACNCYCYLSLDLSKKICNCYGYLIRNCRLKKYLFVGIAGGMVTFPDKNDLAHASQTTTSTLEPFVQEGVHEKRRESCADWSALLLTWYGNRMGRRAGARRSEKANITPGSLSDNQPPCWNRRTEEPKNPRYTGNPCIRQPSFTREPVVLANVLLG